MDQKPNDATCALILLWIVLIGLLIGALLGVL